LNEKIERYTRLVRFEDCLIVTELTNLLLLRYNICQKVKRRVRMRKIFIILIAVMLSMFTVIVLAACSAPNSMLDDTKWFLRLYGEQNSLHAIIEDTEITATFNSAKDEVSGSAGCNTYFARYEVKGSKLSIFEMAFTEMACVSPEGVMEQEQEFLTILTNAQSFQADDTTLTIVCSGGQQLYFTTATRIQS